MAVITAQARATERIVGVCRAPIADERSLRLALVQVIRRVVGFDAFAWLLTDPETENTVQDHLKSIFIKTDTSNRRTLLARVVGQ